MLYGDFVFGIFLLQTILFALFAILTLFQGRLIMQSISFLEFTIYFFLNVSFLKLGAKDIKLSLI
ncbi:hypothetical protein [Leptospira noguchii]|uniref:hypothetical protein n=1 Tax=Leptospira noguchii TaxID=28182 RepID=UPI0009E42805|nr:hypothetical protein [Leptospira noguchii]